MRDFPSDLTITNPTRCQQCRYVDIEDTWRALLEYHIYGRDTDSWCLIGFLLAHEKTQEGKSQDIELGKLREEYASNNSVSRQSEMLVYLPTPTSS